jgi:hypothetical protein
MSDGELSWLEVLRDLDQKTVDDGGNGAAAEVLRLEQRQVFRLLRAYRAEGATGIIPTHQPDHSAGQQAPARRSIVGEAYR